jgi:HD superfamily phosphodiesterase
MMPLPIHGLWKAALPYLDTRSNTVHTAISLAFARRLLDAEGGDEAVVLPAIILHDVGWKTIPEALLLTAFGPGAFDAQLNRQHELEGARIAGDILRRLGGGKKLIAAVSEIIEGHDSRCEALSNEDMLVKDADRLWRYTRTGLSIDIERFRESREAGLKRLETNRAAWLFTPTARRLAAEHLMQRRKER